MIIKEVRRGLLVFRAQWCVCYLVSVGCVRCPCFGCSGQETTLPPSIGLLRHFRPDVVSRRRKLQLPGNKSFTGATSNCTIRGFVETADVEVSDAEDDEATFSTPLSGSPNDPVDVVMVVSQCPTH